ncbi:BTA121 domain-containing protein surface lipoprotein [Borrelia hermsii]|uniref:Lipoprotein n=2 Tax=Borrelia hermsii TaxID=140 RepID=T1ECG8_BORHE|nr:hypothetical protein [Borrelia hermsii]ADN26422.1 hypothetical protein BHA165 [Borrelia hermsii]AMR75998.1 hypothetical protein A0V01_05135 [Borrelia hermsii]ANA43803.1 Mrl-type protein [Borrelia hermsii HS1]UCP02035.1 hypothetical protein K9R62_05190 [Borrelia hermsii]
MFKIRYFKICFLLLLLLGISCNLKPLGRDVAVLNRHKLNGNVADEGIEDVFERHSDISIEDRFNNLINSFELSGEEKEVFEYIRDVVTKSFPEGPAYKAYSEEEFYDLLVGLGVFRVKQIIERNLFIFTLLKEAEMVIEESEYGFKDNLSVFRNAYILNLKEAFSGTTLDEVHYKAINNHRFSNNYAWRGVVERQEYIKNYIDHVIEVERMYAELSDEEKEVLEYIRDVVVVYSSADVELYNMYANIDFYLSLGRLGIDKVKQLVYKVSLIFQNFKEAKKWIGIIEKDKMGLKEKLQSDFKSTKEKFADDLRNFFISASGGHDFKSQINDLDKDDYSCRKFDDISEDAIGIIEANNIYVWLSDEEIEVLEYVRKAVTDPDPGDLENDDLGIYSNHHFYRNLSRVGIDAIRRFAKGMLLFCFEKYKKSKAIVDRVARRTKVLYPESQKRSRVEAFFEHYEKEFLLNIKRAYDSHGGYWFFDGECISDFLDYVHEFDLFLIRKKRKIWH